MDKPTILVVDDEPQNLHVMVEILKADYRVKIAKSGEKALSIVARDAPDMILLDVNMPEMDGYAVCEQLKASDDSRSIPVIFLSGTMSEADRGKGLALGAIEFVKKPADPDHLGSLIRNALD